MVPNFMILVHINFLVEFHRCKIRDRRFCFLTSTSVTFQNQHTTKSIQIHTTTRTIMVLGNKTIAITIGKASYIRQ